MDIYVTQWCDRHYATPADAVGCIPAFTEESDPRPAKEQIEEKYIGGWHDATHLFKRDDRGWLIAPPDPPLPPVAWWMLRDEKITIYPGSWTTITQPDGSFVVSRLD